jgi:hypothetical protein
MTTTRPIRVHAGLDVHDLPPDTPARRPGKHAQDQPLELFTGEESVEVEIAGRRRRVAVESDALAADRWWREANSLRDGVRGMSRDLLAIVREGQTQTPREREPAVWAAAYGAAFVRTYDRVHSSVDVAVDPLGIERHERTLHVLTATASPKEWADIADAAVLTAEGSR